MIPVYPATLPTPAASAVTPAERRFLSHERYPTEARTFERYRRSFERVTWPWMNAAKAEAWNDWWTNDLGYGGSWFKSTWPSPRGQVETDRHFVETPTWRFRGGGFWQVSALIETRARGSLPVYEGSALAIGWVDPITGGGTVAHANSGTSALTDFAFPAINTLFAGVVDGAGSTFAWSIASWTPEDGDSNYAPVLVDDTTSVVQVVWQNRFGDPVPFLSDAARGELILTCTIDGTPISVGQRLVAVSTFVVDYATVAWGPE